MLKKILIGLLALILLILLVASRQANEFRVERSAIIAAPAAVIFDQVNNFHHWSAWSPWDKMDPNMKRTYTGPDAGVGASYAWSGTGHVGQGSMTITDSQPNALIRIKLEFTKPFKAVNTTEFTFKGDDKQTTVTWAMFGPNNLMAKVMHLFMNMDKMVGGNFADGLAAIKTAAEAKPSK